MIKRKGSWEEKNFEEGGKNVSQDVRMLYLTCCTKAKE